MTTRKVTLLTLVVLGLCASGGWARQVISLDGQWQCAFGEPKAPPEAASAWQPITVPSTLSWQPEGSHCLWYRKQLRIPAAWSGDRVVVRFDGVKYQHRALLNGKEIGSHLGGYEPVEYDITDKALFGKTNELMVAVQDWTVLLAKNAKVGKPAPGGMHASWVESGILAPIGSQGHLFGIWQSVRVEARPRIWIDDVFVVTSVRKGQLQVNVTVRNAGVTPEDATITARVAEGGSGPKLQPVSVTVPGRGSKAVTMETSWPTPHLWSPDDPHVYTLVVGLRSFAMSDAQEVRFGFREFWIEGDRFLLNGVAINLLATASHPMPQYDQDPKQAFAAAKAAGCVAMRLHAQPWPEQWYQAADESGMLLIWESALWCLSPNYALSNDEFWKNAGNHITAQVKLHRNHPSIVIWSAENELLLCGGDQVKGTEEKLGKLADLIHGLDPTRPVMFEGDADPAGKADIINLHYPHELGWNQWPETAYWLEAPAPLDTYPRTRWEWDRKKPLYVGEFLFVDPSQAEAASILLGDQAYPDIASGRMLAKAEIWEQQVIAFRDAGVAGMCPWTLWETGQFPNPGSAAHQRAYQKLAAFTREPPGAVFGGTVVDRTITVHNDTPRERLLHLRWSLAPETGAWQVTDDAPVSLTPGERARVRVALAIPPVAEEVISARYVVELWEGDKLVFSDSQQWKVYGRERLSGPVPGAPREVAIYDPKGDTTELLDQLGVKWRPFGEGDAARQLRLTSVAMVGADAFTPTGTPVVVGSDDSLNSALRDFVEKGGALIVLPQSRYPGSLIPIGVSGRSSTITFARTPQHPVLAGLSQDDLCHWVPDGVVSRSELVKPAAAGFTAIVDSGSAQGLATAGLAEMQVGRGRIVLCQLDVVAKYGVSPPATRLLRNLLAYAASPPRSPALVGAVCSDRVGEELTAVGARYEGVQEPLTNANLDRYDVLVICDLEQVKQAEDRLRRFVRKGGRVILHNLTASSLPSVVQMLGEPIALRGPAASGRLTDRTGVASGLSNQDLIWLSTPASNFDTPSASGRLADNAIMPPYREVGTATTMEAELMDRPAANSALEPADGGQAVCLYSSGELRTAVSVPRSGPYLLSLRLKGSPAAGAYPEVSIRLDGSPLDALVADREDWETFATLVNLPEGQHELGIAFENDFYAPPEDRNLWVDWVSWTPVEVGESRLRLHTMPGVLATLPEGKGMWVLDQVRWEAPEADQAKARRYLASLLTNLGCDCQLAPGEVISAADMQVKDCQLSYQADAAVTLSTNGVLETQVEFARAGDYLFAIQAQGTAVDGVYPHLELRLDGKPAGAADIKTPGWQTLRISAPTPAGRHTVGLAFTNDDWKPPQDRNLMLRSLTIGTAS